MQVYYRCLNNCLSRVPLRSMHIFATQKLSMSQNSREKVSPMQRCGCLFALEDEVGVLWLLWM